MADTFRFELVSPSALLASEDVSQVTIPGEVGDFGVLPDHSSLLSAIRPGVVEVIDTDGNCKKLFVAGGFADVNDNLCTVLAEGAINVDELNQEEVEHQIKDCKEDVELAENEETRKKCARLLNVEKAKLQAITGELVI